MNRDWKAFFTAEDFNGGNPEVGSMPITYFIREANSLLREALENAPKVYKEERSILKLWSEIPDKQLDTHTARLIDIKPINNKGEG